MKRRVLSGFGTLLALFVLGAYAVLMLPNTFEGDRFIIISRGENFQQVVDSLEKAGIIRSRLLFELAGRVIGKPTAVQTGKYRFTSGISNQEILRDINTGKSTELITVSIPEGVRASRQAKIFSANLGIDSARFMGLVGDTAFARTLGSDGLSLMGYLMPKTYKFYWQPDESELIKTLVGEFWKEFNDTLRQQARKQGLSMREILTMASIVERETAVDSERAIIAGVYYNRLKKRMRLQADPTVQYLLEDGRHLHAEDYQRESAYNTYLHAGLPPGPIANPGIECIRAALYPRKHKYLYFVATGTGGHTFSKTYGEHQRAVQRYRKLKRQMAVVPG